MKKDLMSFSGITNGKGPANKKKGGVIIKNFEAGKKESINQVEDVADGGADVETIPGEVLEVAQAQGGPSVDNPIAEGTKIITDIVGTVADGINESSSNNSDNKTMNTETTAGEKKVDITIKKGTLIPAHNGYSGNTKVSSPAVVNVKEKDTSVYEDDILKVQEKALNDLQKLNKIKDEINNN